MLVQEPRLHCAVRLAAVSAALAVAAATSAGQAGAVTTASAGGLSSGSYTGSAGTLSYELYVPPTHSPASPMPLVVALHGCTQTADVYRQLSGWDTLAASKGFIVVFPQQSSSRNRLDCWNWFLAADMQRGSGEPSLIAGIANSVEQRYSVDPHRVYVSGFSAGAAMANVMAVTYPDMFAAVGIGSGCEYNGLPCVGGSGPDPAQTGREAYNAMGTRATSMPAVVFQGDADSVVAPANAPLIVREWEVTDGLANPNDPVHSMPSKIINGWVPGGRSYTVTDYNDGQGHDGQGRSMIEYWLVHGMNHAWSGGSSSEQYADPAGPSETAAMYAFFAAHPA